MKRYLLLLTTVLFLGSATFAQEEKEEKNEKKEARQGGAPAAAKAAFAKAFPGASKVKWGKEDGDYEASFVQQGKKMSAVYDSNGSLKETEAEISVSELPASAVNYIKQNYKGSIGEAAKITKSNGEVNYEAAVGKTAVIFDANGKFIKAEKD